MLRTLAILSVVCVNLMAANKPLVHGHRGARAVLPENTIPAFEYAIEAGVDVLELDLAVTKDNVLVVSHDPMLNTALCKDAPEKKPIRELTLAELKGYDCGALKNPLYPKQKPVPGTSIPTLEEVFALARRGKFDFNIETKIFARQPQLTPSPEVFVKLILVAVKRHGLERRVILQSFDFRTLHAMKKAAPGIRLAALFEGTPRSFVEMAKEAGAGIVSPHYSLVTKEKVEEAHQAGLRVIPWTPNTLAEWQRMVDCGADEIITDDPAELISFLRLRRGR